jgi:hypothetical protein
MRICNSRAAFLVISPGDGFGNSIAVFKNAGLNPEAADRSSRAAVF